MRKSVGLTLLSFYPFQKMLIPDDAIKPEGGIMEFEDI
jgi:hypothetical protein